MPEERRETDLVLPIGVHAFVLDTTKGNVNVYVGPMKQPLSPQQELPVIMEANGRFKQVPQDQAIMRNVVVEKGQYVVLRNPAKGDRQPKLGASTTPDPEGLRIGEVENIPGPTSFALWPMQQAEVRAGHHLKSNQYLVVRVYDEDAARANWSRGTMKLVEKVDKGGKEDKVEDQDTAEKPKLKISEVNPAELVMGQQIVIKGTEVSFYIPPTGVEVLTDETRQYVREALTLERLEYCLLVDEDGNKRYVKGPDVVFPEPTETFKVNDDGLRKSRAYELNEVSGLHIKVIAPYKDAYGVEHNEGDELFITGRRTSGGSEEESQIYFPRVEHAILKYSGRTRYHAIAIPAGEARYVLSRLTGEVRLEHGPSMFLPDPRKEVIVKRILSDSEVASYYPGNDKVRQYNEQLRITNQEAEEAAALTGMPAYRTGHVDTNLLSSSVNYASASMSPKASRSADVIDRGTTYTPPRTIILDSKFEGAVQVRPWTGYAIQVVNQKGDRRIEVGPKTVQLEFDERLEVLSLSTGTPKRSDSPLRTVYLRVSNNAVSDKILVKTADLVPVQVHLKYLVRFEEEHRDLWFNIDNYVQNMVDRFRSLVNNHVRTIEVSRFYGNATSILRDLILGAKGDSGRSGFFFEENGMRVYELDVLAVDVLDQAISGLMKKLNDEQITNALEMHRTESKFLLTKKVQETERLTASELFETEKVRVGIEAQTISLRQENEQKRAVGELTIERVRLDGQLENQEVRTEVVKLGLEARSVEYAQEKREEEDEFSREIQKIINLCEADVKRSGAIQPQLVQALVGLAHAGILPVIAKEFANLSIVRQQSLGGTFEAMFKGTPLESLLSNMKNLGAGAVVG